MHKGQVVPDAKIACGNNSYDVISYDKAKSFIAKNKRETVDKTMQLNRLTPVIIEQEGFYHLGLKDRKEDQQFKITPHALNQLAVKLKFGTYLINQIMGLNQLTANEAEVAAKALKIFLERAEQDKDHFWRFRGDTIRSVQSDRYAVIDNEFLLDAVEQAIPEGGFVHWKCDEDDLNMNLLVPNGSRSTKESDYGGIISITNSEIGKRLAKFTPGVFRSLCLNGMIFDRKNEEPIKKKHLGKIDLEGLKVLIKLKLMDHLELLPQGIDSILESQKQFLPENLNHRNVLAQIAMNHKLIKNESAELDPAYQVEPSRSKFGIINAITRASQKMSVDSWNSLNSYAGLIAEDTNAWNQLIKKSKTLSEEEVVASLTNPA